MIISSLNQAAKAVASCIAINNLADCLDDGDDDVNGTLQAQAGTEIETGEDGTSVGCVLVKGTGNLAGFSGCTAFDALGKITLTSTKAEIEDITAAACSTAGVCTH